jgi:hypothetical protein
MAQPPSGAPMKACRLPELMSDLGFQICIHNSAVSVNLAFMGEILLQTFFTAKDAESHCHSPFAIRYSSQALFPGERQCEPEGCSLVGDTLYADLAAM